MWEWVIPMKLRVSIWSRGRTFLLLILATLVALTSCVAPIEIHQGSSGKITLNGKLTAKSFYGPPNFGENPATDTKETVRLLSLEKGIDVANKDSGSVVRDIRQIQVFALPSTGIDVFSIAPETNVTIVGRILPATTGHHHTAVLLSIERIDKKPKQNAINEP